MRFRRVLVVAALTTLVGAAAAAAHVEVTPAKVRAGVEVKLVFHVPVVHVDRNGADLQAREHPFDVLGAVVQVHPDMVAGLHAGRLQGARQPVRARVELRVRQALVAAHQRSARADRIGQRLEKIGKVEFHGRK